MAIDLLIVDDSELFRTMLRRKLESAGCRVVGEAGDAYEGLRLARATQPQLVTLDILMPLVNGINSKLLFRTIRTELPATAVIVMSTLLKAPEKAEYLAEGALDYFQKPYVDFHQLYEKLRRRFPNPGE
ncbi:MAG: response regulator [Candidatus Binataceae bacterium]